jgi:hypothetical protein
MSIRQWNPDATYALHKRPRDDDTRGASADLEATLPTKKKKRLTKNPKKCIACKEKQPTYGPKGGRPKDARWCLACKPPDAVDVVNKKCIACKEKQPNYGPKGGRPKDRRWCLACKPPDAVDVVNKKCIACKDKIPSYGPKGGRPKDARWCVACKPPDAVDVKSKRCIACKDKIPTYGPNGGRPKDARWCLACKPPDAVDVVNKKCIVCEDKIPTYGPKGGRPKDARWCLACKPPDAVDVVSKMCVTENCDTRACNTALKGYCMECFSYKFPTHKLVRFARSEEMAVLDAVYTRFVDENWAQTMVHDRSIEGGCSQKRPDIFVDLGTHILIVEVDEYQHKRGNYSSCDNMRTMTLFQDAGSRPTVFLRFNPHGYVAANGVAVPSPWTKTKTEQKPRVIDKHRTEWVARLQCLFERIEYWTQLEDFPRKEVTVEYLFYDS